MGNCASAEGAAVKKFYTTTNPPVPNPQLVDLAIRMKGLKIPKHEVNILAAENRTPAMLKLNPAGQLPFFELENGKIVSDTIAMVEYLDEMYPNTHPMIGKTAEEKADTRMWQRRLEEHIIYPTFTAFRFWTSSDDAEGSPFKGFFEGKAPVLLPDAWKGMQEWATNRLMWLEEQKKAKNSDFVCGSKVTIVDYQLFTTLRFFAVPGFGDYIKGDYDLPWTKAWFARMEKRAEVKAYDADVAKLAAAAAK